MNNRSRISKSAKLSIPRVLRFVVAIVAVGCITGCVATAPRSQVVSHDALLSRKGGVLIVVDASVQRDLVRSSSDYFVVKPAADGAHDALEALQKYIRDSDIPVRAQIVSVCAARLNADNSPIRVAETVGGPVRESRQPVEVFPSITNDSAYAKALGKVCTYAFERAAVPGAQDPSVGGALTQNGQPVNVNLQEFRDAARVLADRTQASSVLFLGMLGNSRSDSMKFVQVATSLVVSGAVAFATAGLGTGYYMIFMPGHQVDGLVMEGALIDLKSGRLTWSNAVQVRGDPVDPHLMANPEAMDLLFHGILFEPSSAHTTPASTP